MIDLRSDTVTRPTPAMRQAIAAAEVGDDVYGEDPTVRRLEEAVAELLGAEAALFVPSGTMANQIALRAHARPGEEVLIGKDAHCWLHESGALAALAGAQAQQLPGDGRFDGQAVRDGHKPPLSYLSPTTVVAVENTHNMGGGAVWPRPLLDDVLAAARDLGLGTHLDGARLWNAAAATGAAERDLARGFDTISVCLSKGLGAPAGSVVAGRRALVTACHRFRKMYGGGMRQAGILAAAGLHALAHHRARLVDDHAHARLVAERLADVPGLAVDPTRVETNIVMVEVAAPRSAQALVDACAAQGVRISAITPRRLRLVTHLDVDRAACVRAAAVLAEVAREAT
ncbi:MAG: aminotransferase class I/II-fold pyridoxal phosphate-dependent enzyme [Kofleriaceae bacterium]|nr:aminotransferase class I/II-fold pyridoxal phosphate-dependent enzyme [Kofleriaceae bacterium]MCL4226172.1 aminotransferase class I/II-fold pyridoxal phosphate-dependent enzyme [Myxococcales bacterium]